MTYLAGAFALGRAPDRAATCTLVATAELGNVDSKLMRQSRYRLAMQRPDLPSLDPSEHYRADPRLGGQLGLCQAQQRSPISGVSLISGNADDLVDFYPDHAEHLNENWNLGSPIAAFPAPDRGFADIGGPRDIGHSAVAAGSDEPGGIEPARHATGHRCLALVTWSAFIGGHDARFLLTAPYLAVLDSVHR